MKSEFKDFQRIFKGYQKQFGLNSYKVYFKHEPISDSFANIIVDQDGMVATVRFNNDPGESDKPFQNIPVNAKHEAIHLLVGRLSDYAQSRYITKADICEAEEELVRRLETLIPDV
jgi:hypothetical protein